LNWIEPLLRFVLFSIIPCKFNYSLSTRYNFSSWRDFSQHDENFDLESLRYNFSSWRDFSQHDEFDLEDAECRFERKFMEKENLKIRKEYIEEERKREEINLKIMIRKEYIEEERKRKNSSK
jgi:hypothetical protein